MRILRIIEKLSSLQVFPTELLELKTAKENLTKFINKVNKMSLQFETIARSVHVIVKGVVFTFCGDELTSPEQQAILKLKELDEDALDEK
jgi:hypothetical protein